MVVRGITVFIGRERGRREGGRERETETETETDRDRHRQRQTQTQTDTDTERENSKTLILKDSSIRSTQPVLAILQTQISTTILQAHNYEHE